jgi:hypothetical protein
MKKNRSKIRTLEDVRKWKELKKDELELEKLKLYAEKEQIKSSFTKGIGKLFLYEGIFLAGKTFLFSLIKSYFKSPVKSGQSANIKPDPDNK